MTKLVRTKHENLNSIPAPSPVRARHAARHARNSGPRPSRRPILAIRSAERPRLTDTPRQTARYWQSSGEPLAELGTGRQLHRVGDLDREPPPAVKGRSRAQLRRLLTAGAAAALVACLAVESSQTPSAPYPRPAGPAIAPPRQQAAAEAAAARDRAAAWVASEVGAGAILACDPAMCAVLARHGVPAGNLLAVGPGASGADDPLGSNVVLATAALRGTFGSRLTSVYAPVVMASFGTGPVRIDVRAVAPDGAAAYRIALAADLRARRSAGLQLLADQRLGFSAAARVQLTAGLPDARLLMTLATLAASEPVRVVGFGGAGPGAGPGLPLRAVQITAPAAAARAILVFFRAQRPPYQAARAAITTTPTAPAGRSLLTIEFAAPTPLGLLASR